MNEHIALAIKALQHFRGNDEGRAVLTEQGVQWVRVETPTIDDAIAWLMALEVSQ